MPLKSDLEKKKAWKSAPLPAKTAFAYLLLENILRILHRNFEGLLVYLFTRLPSLNSFTATLINQINIYAL